MTYKEMINSQKPSIFYSENPRDFCFFISDILINKPKSLKLIPVWTIQGIPFTRVSNSIFETEPPKNLIRGNILYKEGTELTYDLEFKYLSIEEIEELTKSYTCD